MLPQIQIDSSSETPIYRQLFDQIAISIKTGSFRKGERLPPTRELAIQLGLNRTTVSAAYTLLEENGLIEGHVGRGSFVAYSPITSGPISFASSRPSEDEFPMAEFRSTCEEVLADPSCVRVLQLGSPAGYAPLRSYLLEQARAAGEASADDDVLVTSGCQQAFDLVQRVLGGPVLIEDPVYHGLKNVFARSGVKGIRTGIDGIDLDEVRAHAGSAKLLAVTSSFQNPTGATLPLAAREALARMDNLTIIENAIYADLRYEGEPLPSIKAVDPDRHTVLLRSFSKVAFPGLRVGWVIAKRGLIARLADAKQWCDLHTDQLSQAILLRFAESGRLASHTDRVRTAGAQRLKAVLDACEQYLPPGSEFSRPQGGMSLWVRLPEPLDATELLPRAEREGVTYLPGRHFAVERSEPGTLRLSFGGLSPAQIETGVRTLGEIFKQEYHRSEPVGETSAPALV